VTDCVSSHATHLGGPLTCFSRDSSPFWYSWPRRGAKTTQSRGPGHRIHSRRAALWTLPKLRGTGNGGATRIVTELERRELEKRYQQLHADARQQFEKSPEGSAQVLEARAREHNFGGSGSEARGGRSGGSSERWDHLTTFYANTSAASRCDVSQNCVKLRYQTV
jgi:hypothetical protein